MKLSFENELFTLKVDTATIGVYWNIGKLLSERKIEKEHGDGVVNRFAIDLKLEFPDMGAFSS